MKIFLGISLTLNFISGILFFIIYKYGLKSLKRKIENYTLENFMDLDFDIREVEHDHRHTS